MANRALLIASPVGDLEGPIPDAKRMEAFLRQRDFQTHSILKDATRLNILRAFQRLVGETSEGDKVAVYYSGHGAHSLDEEYEPADDDAPSERFHQFIVPQDIFESSEDDFRGILDLELSSLLSQLTARTKNVTVVFDCCHSGGMSRGLRLRPKSLSKSWYFGAHRHFEKARDGEIPELPPSKEDNPHAVRVMAALPTQQAWEYDGAEGAYGLMTRALLTAFEESEGLPVTWAAIKERVRREVRQLEPGQYPDVEGPERRFAFQLEEADLTGVLPLRLTEEGPQLEGGRLLGVDVGDKYLIMPSGHQKTDQEKALAVAVVTQVSGAWSSVDFDPNDATVTEDARAFPIELSNRRRPVVVEVTDKWQSSLETAISESGFLRLGDPPNEQSHEALWVRQGSDNKFRIQEQPELDFIAPIPPTDDPVAKIVGHLTRLIRARKLERLEAGTGTKQLLQQYQLDWGRVVDGALIPMEQDGALLHVGDHVYVRVRNLSHSNLYVSVFDIGISGNITLLNRNTHPSGIELLAGQESGVGYRQESGWKGIGPITWPKNVPNDGTPRPESLVVIISDAPQDLRVLETRDETSQPKGNGPKSQLERELEQFTFGRSRDLSPEEDEKALRYSVEHVHAVVEPTASPYAKELGRHRSLSAKTRSAVDASSTTATFLIDDRPAPSVAYRRPRGDVATPEQIAVQLGEIIVHRNRALFSADVRVDALVVTGGKNPVDAFHAKTQRFSRIGDNERLPLDKMLAYHGSAHGFIDLAVWVSRDNKSSLSLMEMLKEQMNSVEFKEAALILTGLVAAPSAGAVVAGMGAAAVVGNVAYRLISHAVGTSIGLYRTSMLANEGFGVGRHPSSGTMRAQDFSFWYEVTEV